jgi:hypothetical protein
MVDASGEAFLGILKGIPPENAGQAIDSGRLGTT